MTVLEYSIMHLRNNTVHITVVSKYKNKINLSRSELCDIIHSTAMFISFIYHHESSGWSSSH